MWNGGRGKGAALSKVRYSNAKALPGYTAASPRQRELICVSSSLPSTHNEEYRRDPASGQLASLIVSSSCLAHHCQDVRPLLTCHDLSNTHLLRPLSAAGGVYYLLLWNSETEKTSPL